MTKKEKLEKKIRKMKIKKLIKETKKTKIKKPKISWLERLDKMTLGELADELMNNDWYREMEKLYPTKEDYSEDDISVEEE